MFLCHNQRKNADAVMTSKQDPPTTSLEQCRLRSSRTCGEAKDILQQFLDAKYKFMKETGLHIKELAKLGLKEMRKKWM